MFADVNRAKAKHETGIVRQLLVASWNPAIRCIFYSKFALQIIRASDQNTLFKGLITSAFQLYLYSFDCTLFFMNSYDLYVSKYTHNKPEQLLTMFCIVLDFIMARRQY